MQILLFNLAALVGALSQGLTGFGSGTLMVSTLVLLYPFREVVPIVALVALATTFVMGALTWRDFDWKRGPLAAISMAVGVIGGAQLLAILPVDVLQRTLGLAVLCYATINLIKTPVPTTMPQWQSRDRLGLSASALFSGLIVGAVGVSPVPLLIYTNIRYPKQFSRSILTMAFLVSSVVQITVYSHLGLLTPHRWLIALAVMPAIMLGLAAGHRLHYRVDQKTFSRILALVLLLPALRLVIG